MTPPSRPVKRFLLRAPLPAGWRVESVEIDGMNAPLVSGDTVDLTGRVKPLTIKFAAKTFSDSAR